nr:hypothetical protein [Shewanella mesophila]
MNKVNLIAHHQLDQTKKVEDKLAWIYLINLGFYLIPLFVQTMPL